METKSGKRCTVIGCAKIVAAQGLCDTHYKRLRRHNDVEAGRPADWGDRAAHPLYSTWKGYMRYHRNSYPVWSDFWAFAADVKEVVPDARFGKRDRSAPFSASNWYWQRLDRTDATVVPREKARIYQQKLRAINPDYFRDKDLQKNYGVNMAWYNAEFEKQNGVCAICFKPETAIIKGKLLPLSVDHCHDTGKVRGLLCRRCNNGIGHMKHDVRLLQNAINYLDIT